MLNGDLEFVFTEDSFIIDEIESKGWTLTPSKYIEFIDHDLEIDYENTLNSDIEGFGVKLNFYNSKDELVYYYSVKLPDTIKVSEKDTIYTSILEKYAGIEYIEMEIDTEI